MGSFVHQVDHKPRFGPNHWSIQVLGSGWPTRDCHASLRNRLV